MIFSRSIPAQKVTTEDVVLQRLPLELVFQVIDLLDIESVVQCTEVNKAWRKLLLDPKEGYLKPWRDFRRAYQAPTAFRILPRVLRYINILSLPGQPRAALQCIKLLENYPTLLRNLRTLKIRDYDENFPPLDDDNSICDEDYGSFSITNHLAGALRKTLELENLHVIWANTESEVSFDKLLSTCRQLRSIYFRMKYALKSLSSRQMPSQTLLTKIELGGFSYSMNCRPLFENSPALRYLRMFKCSDVFVVEDLLPIIGDCCPRLEVLITELGSFDYKKYELGLLPNTVEIDDERPRGGLRFLWSHCLESALPLIARLEQNQQSLKALYFVPMESPFVLPHWEALALVTLPKLTYLNIKIYEETDIYDHVPALLRQCPALGYLYLSGLSETEEEIPGDVFSAMAVHRNLAHLFLENLDISNPSFIRAMKKFERVRRLQTLSLTRCQFTNVEVLYCAGRIGSLKSLTIILDQPSADFTSAYHVRKLTELICNQLRCLESLELGNINISPQAAKNLTCCNLLHRLILTDVETLKLDTFTRLGRSINTFTVRRSSDIVDYDSDDDVFGFF